MSIDYDFSQLGKYTTLLWGYSWIHVDTYLINNFENDRYDHNALFKAFIHHDIYKRTYWATKAYDKTTSNHGPFKISKIKPKNYIHITRDQFNNRINDIFYSEFGFSEDDDLYHVTLQKEARLIINSILDVNFAYYELDIDLENKKYRHDDWVVHHLFHEFILVDTQSSRLILFIIGGD